MLVFPTTSRLITHLLMRILWNNEYRSNKRQSFSYFLYSNLITALMYSSNITLNSNLPFMLTSPVFLCPLRILSTLSSAFPGYWASNWCPPACIWTLNIFQIGHGYIVVIFKSILLCFLCFAIPLYPLYLLKSKVSIQSLCLLHHSPPLSYILSN